MTRSNEPAGIVTQRRLFLAGLALAGFAAIPAWAAADKAKTALLTALREEEDFMAPPHRVYQALLDERQFSAFTGAPAKINPGEGGAMSLFGGAIVARNVELVPDKRIVQAWRDAAWSPGIYSMLKFELTPKGTGTHLVLGQTGFPAGQFSDLDSGWHEHYLAPMKKYFHA
jgi:activator of HSP90 ATPase